MQSHGIHAFPYTNGRLFDFKPKPGNDTTGRPFTCTESIAAWQADHAARYACGREACPTCDQFYAEGYNQRTFAVMDPSTDYWQATVANRTARLAHSYDVDGKCLYLPVPTISQPGLID